jgi:hypothetical protein
LGHSTATVLVLLGVMTGYLGEQLLAGLGQPQRFPLAQKRKETEKATQVRGCGMSSVIC